jgi:hypothetical protein
MTLLELQRRMATDVTRPLTADFRMQLQSADGGSVEKIAEGYIKPNDRLSSFDRLEIYNRQYWFRLTAALTEDFSALQAVVGSRKFDALVLAYLRENPSTSFTLRNLGAGLPEWLAGHPELSSRRHQLALDVARLEWAYVESYDGAAVDPVNESDLAHLSGESRLSLQPHVQLLALKYPVDELVLAVHQAQPSIDIMSNAVVERKQMDRISLPTMRRSATYIAVHRYENTVYYRRLDPEAYLLLYSIQQQLSLAEAITVAFAKSERKPEEHPGKIQEYFAHASELGWLCR